MGKILYLIILTIFWIPNLYSNSNFNISIPGIPNISSIIPNQANNKNQVTTSISKEELSTFLNILKDKNKVDDIIKILEGTLDKPLSSNKAPNNIIVKWKRIEQIIY